MSDFVHEQYPGRLPTGELRPTPQRGLRDGLMPTTRLRRFLLGGCALLLILFVLALAILPSGVG